MAASDTNQPAQTLLVTLTGTDRPGVTAQFLGSLSGSGLEVLDAEQVVIRGRLVLGLLLAAGTGGCLDDLANCAETVRQAAAELSLDCQVEPGAAEEDPRKRGRVLVTVMAEPLRPGALSAVAAAAAEQGANIDRIVRVASYPVTALELEVSGADPESLRKAMARVAAAQQLDLAVQRPGLARRGARLVILDVDSTLIQDEVIELMARRSGTEAAVAAVTARAMSGELDFASSLRERVALLAGVPESVFDDVAAEIRLTPGARTLCRTLKHLGYHVALVSGGFTPIVQTLGREVGADHVRANDLEVIDGVLTGRVLGAIVDRQGKARALDEFAALHGIPLSRTVAIGDGANDLDMLARAGLGIAFNAKPVVRAAADAAVTAPYLDAVLYLLGVTREEIEEADAG